MSGCLSAYSVWNQDVTTPFSQWLHYRFLLLCYGSVMIAHQRSFDCLFSGRNPVWIQQIFSLVITLLCVIYNPGLLTGSVDKDPNRSILPAVINTVKH